MLHILRRLISRSKNNAPPFDFARNRYKAKKKWPPKVRELTDKQQFRYERKLKRRVLMKSSNTTWQKWVGIVQWSSISFIVVYSVLFYDYANDPGNPTPGVQPFQGLRDKMWRLFGSVWTHTGDNEGREALRRRPPPTDTEAVDTQGRKVP